VWYGKRLCQNIVAGLLLEGGQPVECWHEDSDGWRG